MIFGKGCQNYNITVCELWVNSQMNNLQTLVLMSTLAVEVPETHTSTGGPYCDFESFNSSAMPQWKTPNHSCFMVEAKIDRYVCVKTVHGGLKQIKSGKIAMFMKSLI